MTAGTTGRPISRPGITLAPLMLGVLLVGALLLGGLIGAAIDVAAGWHPVAAAPATSSSIMTTTRRDAQIRAGNGPLEGDSRGTTRSGAAAAPASAGGSTPGSSSGGASDGTVHAPGRGPLQ